jgi:hypothetical protein
MRFAGYTRDAPLAEEEDTDRTLTSLRHRCNHVAMIRTQIQLTEEQAAVLRRRAQREQVSMAELVRQAIDVFTRTEPPDDRHLRQRAIHAAGRFASGVGDTSARHDEVFAETVRAR